MLRVVIKEEFSSNFKEGEAARKLYTQFGFNEYEEAVKNHAGIDTVIMKLECVN